MSNSNSIDQRIKFVIKFNSLLDNLQLSKIIEKVYITIIDVAKKKYYKIME